MALIFVWGWQLFIIVKWEKAPAPFYFRKRETHFCRIWRAVVVSYHSKVRGLQTIQSWGEGVISLTDSCPAFLRLGLRMTLTTLKWVERQKKNTSCHVKLHEIQISESISKVLLTPSHVCFFTFVCGCFSGFDDGVKWTWHMTWLKSWRNYTTHPEEFADLSDRSHPQTQGTGKHIPGWEVAGVWRDTWTHSSCIWTHLLTTHHTAGIR